jgi:uncharacterized protein (TIGR02996 family)
MIREDLIHAIREDPASDAPRLVCADYLMERGDPRGEFIAMACNGQPYLQPPYDLARAWRAPLEQLGAQGLTQRHSLDFHRGFIEWVTLVGRTATSFPALCALEPVVTLSLYSSGPRNYAALATTPEVAQLRSLSLWGRYQQGREVLLASPLLANIGSLFVVAPDDAVVDALAGSVMRPRSITLDIDLASRERLIASGFYARIEHCPLHNADDDTLLALAATPLAELRRLELRDSLVTARGIAALGDRLDQLEQLTFESTPFDRAIAEVCIHHMRSGRLRKLKVTGTDESGIAAFVASPAFAGVETLDLEYGPLPRDALRTTPYRGKLTHLKIGWRQRPSDFALPGVEVEDLDEPW